MESYTPNQKKKKKKAPESHGLCQLRVFISTLPSRQEQAIFPPDSVKYLSQMSLGIPVKIKLGARNF